MVIQLYDIIVCLFMFLQFKSLHAHGCILNEYMLFKSMKLFFLKFFVYKVTVAFLVSTKVLGSTTCGE